MRTSSEPSVASALEHLINQFSDPLSFYRELIQNAVDAGSREVDVWLEYKKGAADGEGAMIIHVDDFGEGMNREIIEGRLTRLFSSGKDGDFTKIGRFGIGFVSIFAIEPDAVSLDTSEGRRELARFVPPRQVVLPHRPGRDRGRYEDSNHQNPRREPSSTRSLAVLARSSLTGASTLKPRSASKGTWSAVP